MKNNQKKLASKHSFLNEAVFHFKSILLTAQRAVQNQLSPVKKFHDEQKLIALPVIAHSESELWNPFDNQDNWILTAGKIENLRIAVKRLHGLEIDANAVFSFWKHVGNPNIGKGYVKGREIREGCVLPTTAGGLCQLSNALYDAALTANFIIVERHKHTQIIKGSLAEKDRDATVKWNYVDLRFKATVDFRIEIELTANKLIVIYRAKNAQCVNATPQHILHRQPSQLNDCYSCGNVACFNYPNQVEVLQKVAKTTFIVDEKWPEFDAYVQSIITDQDTMVVPIKKSKLIKTNRYAWSAPNRKNLQSTTRSGVFRAIMMRLLAKKKNNIFEMLLKLDKKIASQAARLIPVEANHLVISQNLLPFVYATGALGGRTYDVLMTRLPIEKIHDSLDLAFSKYVESETLHDFRAPKLLIDLENSALTKARKIITPHSKIMELFPHKVEKLNWNLPDSPCHKVLGKKILFPASAVGRKGAYEIKRLAKDLNINVVVMGDCLEGEDFWGEVFVEKFLGDWSEIGLVIYPAYIEHQPRVMLQALARNIPVIATDACGVEVSPLITIVNVGDYVALKNAVLQTQQLDKAI